MTAGPGHRGAGLVLLIATVLAGACGPDPELRPDERLQEELGLSAREEVHRVALAGGERESVDPVETLIPEGAWVEFVTTDSWVHEVRFELDSLGAAARDFLVRTDQVASPPMVDPDSRFVLSFADAPPGRYPFLVEGNGAPAQGAVVVRPEGG